MTTVGAWLARHPDLERRDREVLLCTAAGLTRAQVIGRPERPLGDCAAATLEAWVARRRRGEPVAYLVGRREFWGLELEVSPAVLIPRPETELLVETALAAAVGAISRSRSGLDRPAGSRSGDRSHRQDDRSYRILELGTGSGAVAIALAHQAKRSGLPVQITATDVSADALAVAAANGRRHAVEIRWLPSDWFQEVPGRFHMIAANPPYVAADDPHLEDLGHEPRPALVAGADGLDALRAIAAGARAHLEPGGLLALEHGCGQGAEVRALLGAAGFAEIETLADLAGLDRVTRGRLAGRDR